VDRAEAMELGEDPRAERGREAHGLELAAAIGFPAAHVLGIFFFALFSRI